MISALEVWAEWRSDCRRGGQVAQGEVRAVARLESEEKRKRTEKCCAAARLGFSRF